MKCGLSDREIVQRIELSVKQGKQNKLIADFHFSVPRQSDIAGHVSVSGWLCTSQAVGIRSLYADPRSKRFGSASLKEPIYCLL